MFSCKRGALSSRGFLLARCRVCSYSGTLQLPRTLDEMQAVRFVERVAPPLKIAIFPRAGNLKIDRRGQVLSYYSGVLWLYRVTASATCAALAHDFVMDSE